MGAFVSQLHLAASLDLPVIIHCREAHEDTISLLKDFVKLKKNYTLRGVVHSFAGTLSQAQEYLRLGLCISFTANITYPNRPRHVSEVLEQVPLEKIMVETDSPFLPPQSHRGARNEPSMVWEVVGEIAAVKGISISEVEERTTQTAKNLFGIK
jgi:TatD DNase family protein